MVNCNIKIQDNYRTSFINDYTFSFRYYFDFNGFQLRVIINKVFFIFILFYEMKMINRYEFYIYF